MTIENNGDNNVKQLCKMTIKNKADKAMLLCEIQTHSAAHMSYSITTFVCPVLQEKDIEKKDFSTLS